MQKKILICDDSKEILDLFEMILEAEGFDVIIEINSRKLIEQIRTCNPDILLLDLWMPRVSGREILEIIKTDPNMSDLKVIVISASLDGKEVSTILGADDFINKPFDIEELLIKISNLID